MANQFTEEKTLLRSSSFVTFLDLKSTKIFTAFEILIGKSSDSRPIKFQVLRIPCASLDKIWNYD